MTNKFERFFSVSSQLMKRSAIREILKLTQRPGMISFAGGLPSPDSFPVDDIRAISAEVLDTEGRTALQYGTTEGDPGLRNMLIERHRKDGLDLSPENIVITTGSQQALDIAGKIFINPGDTVICGLPSYLGGLTAFTIYGARLEGIPLDNEGMIPGLLEERIVTLRREGRVVKFIYVIPDFQNPTGVTTGRRRRMEIISIAERYDLLIVEDSPYREVRFSGQAEPLMSALDTSGRVMTLHTFSKILAPGFRLGWVTGHPDIIDKIVTAKQSADICTPTFIQKIAARYMEKGLLEKNLARTVALYRERRDLMLRCFREQLPGGITWTEPEGGLFLFVTLPVGMDSSKLLERALAKNVAFVTGTVFYCNNQGQNTMRLNFSFSDNEEICTGVKRLAEAVREEMAQA